MLNRVEKSYALLRQKAEELLKNRPSNQDSKLSEPDILKLIHELEVHQVELEMQNEELVMAKWQAEADAAKYAELYDFAPSGYFTLSREGIVVDLNLTGSQILDKERFYLKNSNLGFFISEDTRQIFNIFMEKVFKSNSEESCEVTFLRANIQSIHVYMSGIAIQGGKQCLISTVDLTNSKTLIALQEKTAELERNNYYFINREKKMIELKKEINELLKRLDCEEKYVVHE